MIIVIITLNFRHRRSAKVYTYHSIIKSMKYTVVMEKGEKKMDVSMKKVRLVRHGKGLQFQSQFLPIQKDGVSLGELDEKK